MNLIFLDTETTGLAVEDRLLQVAYKVRRPNAQDFSDPVCELFKPALPITFEAMATHHITESMVEDKQAFSDSQMRLFLSDRAGDSILVAHNAQFDLAMLEKEGVKFTNFIDTQALALHMLDLPSYKLQYLRYCLDLKVEGKAHDAAGDVNVLVALFDHLYKLQADLLKTSDEQVIIDRLTTLSNTPVLMKKFPYGKYFGQSIEEKIKSDRQYCEWMHRNESEKTGGQNESLIFSLKHYLGILI